MILSPALKRSGAQAFRTPDGRGSVANLPSCGPFLSWSPALKRWGPQTAWVMWQGLCSRF